MDLLKPSDLRKGFMGPKKPLPRKRNQTLLLTFLTMVLTSFLIVCVGNDSNGDWFLALKSRLGSQLSTGSTDYIDAAESSKGRSRAGRPQAWVRYPTSSNVTDELLQQLRDHAISTCAAVETRTIRILGLPSAKPGNPIRLVSGDIHKIFIESLDDSGKQLCEGGDYYETDLSGERWKSRPPVTDLQNGAYEIQLQVDENFAGLYVFKVILLYSRFHGLQLVQGPSYFHRGEEVVVFEILFEQPHSSPRHRRVLPEPSLCSHGDYNLSRWSGRWTRSQNNESCIMDSKGRYQCLPTDTECELPWCQGPLDRVDSNGWVYSAHCRFKLFRPDEAWDCLDKKWIFSWGDSTSQHTWQNLLAFVMDYDDLIAVDVPRRMDRTWVRPGGIANDTERQFLRLTMVYNGHANEEGMFQGLESLKVPHFRKYLRSFFVNSSEPDHSPPDILVMNSGLHDAFYYKDPYQFVQEGLSTAITFWKEILDSILPKVPQIIYRTSVATAGKARSKEYNPQKVEHYNRLFVESLQNLNLSGFRIVDGFDLTFPWHYDNTYSDGTHYGLKPNYGTPGHQYFVDHMFAHMLLNSICLQ